MLNITATIFGADSLISTFKKSRQIIQESASDALDKVGLFIQGKGKTYAPVKTGNLRISIHKEGPTVSGKNVSVIVGTNVPYAPYQEFGTSRGVRPKLYMTRATEEAKQQFPSYLRDAGVNIVSGLCK